MPNSFPFRSPFSPPNYLAVCDSSFVGYLSLFISLALQLHASGVFVDTHSVANGLCSVAGLRGYRCEEFQVTTSDGYVLGLYRIQQGSNGGGAEGQQPVLLQHGVLVDGVTWVINDDPGQNLPTILGDNGFDVWISNIRGTQFSRRHLTLQLTNPAFWDWSWDELVAYEIPSVVEFIVSKTGQNPHYIGHSMGGLIAVGILSEGGFQNVKSAALLCPFVYTSHITSAPLVAAARLYIIEILRNKLGVAELNPKGPVASAILPHICADPTVDCYNLLLTSLTGENCCLNKSTIQTFLQNELQPTSTKNLIHFAQTIRSGVLSKYDYSNPLVNSKQYGNSSPPLYNPPKIRPDFPLLICHGGRDALSVPQDVAELLKIIRESHDENKLRVQYVDEYAHLDFVMGVNAKDIVYNQVVNFLKSQDQV